MVLPEDSDEDIGILLPTKFKHKLVQVLSDLNIDEESKKWILKFSFQWDSLDELDESEDLSKKKIKLLKQELQTPFAEFKFERSSIIENLVTMGVERSKIKESQFLNYWFRGNKVLKLFLRSDEASQWFNEDDLETIFLNGFAFNNEQISTLRRCNFSLSAMETVLQELELEDDAITWILQNFQKFETLDKGLEDCIFLSEKQKENVIKELRSDFQWMISERKKIDNSADPGFQEPEQQDETQNEVLLDDGEIFSEIGNLTITADELDCNLSNFDESGSDTSEEGVDEFHEDPLPNFDSDQVEKLSFCRSPTIRATMRKT